MFVDLIKCDERIHRDAAFILADSFTRLGIDTWPDISKALTEVNECLDEEYYCIGLLKNDELLGWAGLRPLYEKITWELHPLVIKSDYQRRGFGSLLIKEIERIAKENNVLNIMLGTDDTTFRTNLFEFDFSKENISDIIPKIKNLNDHQYEFYEKNGYKIIGILPDANGPGKPDIWMWKQIQERVCSR